METKDARENELLDLSIHSEDSSKRTNKHNGTFVEKEIKKNGDYKIKIDLKFLKSKYKYSHLFSKTKHQPITADNKNILVIDHPHLPKENLQNEFCFAEKNYEEKYVNVEKLRNILKRKNSGNIPVKYPIKIKKIGDVPNQEIVKHHLPLLVPPEREKYKIHKDKVTTSIQTEKVFIVSEKDYELLQHIKAKGKEQSKSSPELNNNNQAHEQTENGETIVIDDDTGPQVNEKAIQILVNQSEENKARISKFININALNKNNENKILYQNNPDFKGKVDHMLIFTKTFTQVLDTMIKEITYTFPNLTSLNKKDQSTETSENEEQGKAQKKDDVHHVPNLEAAALETETTSNDLQKYLEHRQSEQQRQYRLFLAYRKKEMEKGNMDVMQLSSLSEQAFRKQNHKQYPNLNVLPMQDRQMALMPPPPPPPPPPQQTAPSQLNPRMTNPIQMNTIRETNPRPMQQFPQTPQPSFPIGATLYNPERPRPGMTSYPNNIAGANCNYTQYAQWEAEMQRSAQSQQPAMQNQVYYDAQAYQNHMTAVVEQQKIKEMEMQKTAWESQLTNYPNSAWSRMMKEQHLN